MYIDLNLFHCCREKLAAAEAKVRALVQEKNNIVAERGNVERELKALKATSAKLVKATSSCQMPRSYNHKIICTMI